MAVNKFLSSQYPSFVTDAFNQYQPQFLQSLLNQQPLVPLTGGEQGVIQQGRDFTSNPLSNPLFSAYSQAQTNLMAPSEDIARRNLADQFRRAGAGTLQSGAFAEGASNLERDLATNRGDLITKGYAQLYPAIGNQLNNQAGLEALPRLQQEKPISLLQSLLGAHNQSTGTYNENTTGENIAQFASPLLAAILGSPSGSTGNSIGSSILGLLKSGAVKIGDLLGLTGDTSNLDSLLQDLPDSGLGNLLPDALSSGLGNYGNFDFSGISPGDWSFGSDFGNTGNWGFDFSNFSNPLAGDAATAGADTAASALDNFQPFDLPYSGAGADVGALAGSMSGSAPLGDIGSLGGGIGGSVAMAGLSAAMNALGAPPAAQSIAGVLAGALLGANPITLPFAFLGPILSSKPYESPDSVMASIREIQRARSTIQSDLAAGRIPSLMDVRASLFQTPGEFGNMDPVQQYADQVFKELAQGKQPAMSGENYLFQNIPLFAGKDDSYGLSAIPQFTLPQAVLSPQDFQTAYTDLYGDNTEWFPGMYDALIQRYSQPKQGPKEDY